MASGSIIVNACLTDSGIVADVLEFSWWEISQSVTENTTTAGWKLDLIAYKYGRINSSASKKWSVTFAGQSYSGTNTIGISANSTKTLASGTTVVSHESDGTKTCTFSFSQEIKINFGASGTYIGTKSGDGSGTLTTIDRALEPPIFTEDNFVIAPSGITDSTFSGLYIQGKTAVTAFFTASSPHSTIASYKLLVEGREYAGNPASSQVLTREGSIPITGTVYDASGNHTSQTKTITVLPYFPPSIEPHEGEASVVCRRQNENGEYTDSGTILRIRARIKRSFVNVNGANKNFCGIKYRYKEDEGNWSDYKPLLSIDDNSDDNVDAELSGIVSRTDKSYIVQLVVFDTIGTNVPYDFPIGTDKVTLHLKNKGKGAAFGKYSEKDNCLECVWDFEVDGDITTKENATISGSLFPNHIAGIDSYNGKDFNDLCLNTGYYPGIATPTQVGCKNYPVDITGVLEVISVPDEINKQPAFAYQTYRTWDGGIYTRSYWIDRGWTEWKK